MDSAVDAATPLGAWAWIRGCFTPATLFLVVNLVIGTIALTSRAATQHQQRRRRREEHYYHDDAHGHHFQEQPLQQPGYGGHYYHPEQQTLYAAAPPPPAPLARTSSVLDRLRSLGLYRFRSGDFPPEFGAAAAAPNYAQDVFAPVEEDAAATAHYARSRSEPAAAAREEDERRPAPAPAPAPPRVKKSSGSEARKSQVARAVPRAVVAVAEDDDDSVEARVGEAVAGFRRGPSPLQQEYNYQEEYVPPVRPRAAAPAPLQRTPSVLDRLRSFGLYGFLAPDQPATAAAAVDGFATPADEKRDAHAHYDRSRSEPAPEKQGKKEKQQPEAKSRMAKSSSEARKKPAPRRAETGGECVNARAEAFIDSFRQQQQQGAVHHYQEPEEEEYVPPPAPLPRTSSVLDRLRSFSLYRFRSGDLGPDLPSAAAAAAETDENKEAAHYGRSRSEPAREQGKKKKQQQEARMSKSSSSGAVEEETEQCVDARADDFINKFRQQLQLQRLNSLLNYKEMLGGGKQA